jgi:hypothetical protein
MLVSEHMVRVPCLVSSLRVSQTGGPVLDTGVLMTFRVIVLSCQFGPSLVDGIHASTGQKTGDLFLSLSSLFCSLPSLNIIDFVSVVVCWLSL